MKTFRFFSFFLFLLFSVIIMTDKTTEASILKPHLYKERLDNGLTLIVKEVPGSKAATVQFWVKAGSIYEAENEGGITHLIEHMIFKGTETQGPGELAKAIEEKGGQINAYTSYEYTVYHATLSARHWLTALNVLTDAVLHSTFDPAELAKEKPVVLEEIHMRNDRPNIRLYQNLMDTAYTVHPYKLPIIGTRESVSSFTRDDILSYIDKHYHPENFAIVIVGDVRFSSVEQQVRELLGSIPPKPDAKEAILEQEPPQRRPRVFSELAEINQTHLAMAFPIPPFKDEDTAIIDVIAGILGHGETSRLYHQLRDQQGLVYKIYASAFTPKDAGLFEITATLDGDNLEKTIEAALEEVFKLKYVPVDDLELERVKRNLEGDFIYNLERVEGQARVLGSFEFLAGDPREDDYLAKARAVTKEEIMRVAQNYFNGSSLTAGFVAPQGFEESIDQARLVQMIKHAEAKAKAAIPTSLVANSYLDNVHRFKLDNGMRLMVREDSSVPTVAIRAVFPGGLMAETSDTSGAFSFLSDLLPKGTEQLSARELALTVADMAGDISGFTGKNTFGLKASFLTRFYEKGLELVRDVLITPAFSPEEAEKIRPEKIAQLQQQEDSLPAVTFRELNRILFQGHPYALNQAGSENVLKKLSAAELKTIYQEAATPDQLVLSIAGDVKADEVYEQVNALFGEWNQPADEQLSEDFLPPLPPESPQIYAVAKEKEQVHIAIGFLGVSMKNPDRYALEILETALSGQSGRLFTILRDQMSLAYSLSAFTLMGVDTGAFGIYIGTSPEKKEEAIKAAWAELYKIRETPLAAEELEKAKNVLIGHYELGLQTHGAQAMEMALTETYSLGQDFGNRYIHELNQVTADEVLDVARKYIQPDHYVLVTVGPESKMNPQESL